MAETTPPPAPLPAQPPAPPPTPDPLTQLNIWAQSIGAKEKAEGKAAAQRELQEALGMSPEDAKKFIDDAKAKQREGMEEADRKLAEATEKETVATTRLAEAAKRELNAEVRAQLVEEGMTKAQAAVVIPMVGVDVKDWDEAKVTEAIAQLKTTLPQLFTSETSPPPPGQTLPSAPPGAGPVDSTPRGQTPPPPPGQPNRQERARQRLLQRHPDLQKSQS